MTLSKSGISTSVGVRGLRIGTGPRGTYVHAGAGGLYYRQTLGSSSHATPSDRGPRAPMPLLEGHRQFFESADVAQLTDTRGAEVTADLNARAAMWPVLPVATAVMAWVLASLTIPALGALVGPGAVASALSAGVLGALAGSILWAVLYHQTARTTLLLYDLEPDAESAYHRLYDAVQAASSCSHVWSVTSKHGVTDHKRNAGAAHLIDRSNVRIRFTSPAGVRTNVSVPMLPAGKEELYFLPDRLLVRQRGQFASIGYDSLNVHAESQRFIEDHAPRDAKVVDTTWQYVNKSGGPDRRFKDNRQLPVCLYGQLHLTSPTGLDELFQFSRPDVHEELRRAIQNLNKVLQQPTTAPVPAPPERGVTAFHAPDTVELSAPPPWRVLLTTGPVPYVLLGGLLAMVGAALLPTPAASRTEKAPSTPSLPSTPVLEATWTAQGATLRITPPLDYKLGLAETGAPAGHAWKGEECSTADQQCHDIKGGVGTIAHVDSPRRTGATTTLFHAGHAGYLTYVLRSGESCWVAGHQPEYFAAANCTPMTLVEALN